MSLSPQFTVSTFAQDDNFIIIIFLGPRGPLVLPLVDPYVHPYALKILTPIYRHICHMNHQKTPQTNPLATWDPLDVSLNPLGPPGPHVIGLILDYNGLIIVSVNICI